MGKAHTLNARNRLFMTEEERRAAYMESARRNPFTPRQTEIINGTADHVTLREINGLITKCEAKENYLLGQYIYEQYEDLLFVDEKVKYSIREAEAILQSLTPWKIRWEDEPDRMYACDKLKR